MSAEARSRPGWRTYRFDQIATNVNQRVDDPSEAGVDYYVGLEHLDSDSLTIGRWGSPADVQATKLRFRKGDIIFGRRRVYQRKVGVAHFDGICSAHAMVLRAKPDVALSEFLPFFMQSDLFMERAKEISVGSLSPTINWPALAREEFSLPPLEEQRRLAYVLSHSEAYQGTLRALTHSAESLLQATVDYGLHGALVSDSRELSTAPTALGALPKHWRVESLGTVCTKIVDGVHKRPTYVSRGVPFLTVENLTRGPGIDFTDVRYVTKEDHHEFSRRACPQAGDVLVSKDGTLGVARVVDVEREFSIFVSLALLKPRREILNPLFLRYYFDSSLFKRRLLAKVSGSALKHIHLVDFRASLIPVPPIEEQDAIVQTIRQIDSANVRSLARLQFAKAFGRECTTRLLSGREG
jgi:restriction endonuclease S subunit